MQAQAAKQKAFLTMVFGGPSRYTGRDMRLSHRGMRISESDWSRFLGHAAATLEAKSGAKAAANKKGPGKKALAPDESATAAAAGGWFDPGARPSNETFQRYFGSLLSASYAHPDAIQLHYLTTPVEK